MEKSPLRDVRRSVTGELTDFRCVGGGNLFLEAGELQWRKGAIHLRMAELAATAGERDLEICLAEIAFEDAKHLLANARKLASRRGYEYR